MKILRTNKTYLYDTVWSVLLGDIFNRTDFKTYAKILQNIPFTVSFEFWCKISKKQTTFVVHFCFCYNLNPLEKNLDN